MSKEFQKHIFEAFAREKQNQWYSCSWQSIEVHSKLGKGTEFIVNLQFSKYMLLR